MSGHTVLRPGVRNGRTKPAAHILLILERTFRVGEKALDTIERAKEQRIRQQLSNDHHTQTSMLDDVAGLIREQSFAIAGRRFGDLRLYLGRHISAEEEIFILCEQLTKPQEIVARLRVDHAIIQGLVQHFAEALSRRTDANELLYILNALRETLDRHEREEQTELFPSLAQLIQDQDRYQGLLLKLAQP
jgi:hypothetical protein